MRVSVCACMCVFVCLCVHVIKICVVYSHFLLSVFDSNAATKNVTAQYKFLKMLRIDSMLDELFTEGVVTLEEKGEIEDKGNKGMNWFLDKVILIDLKQGQSTKYKRFLKVMENHDDMTIRKLAADLGE